jgi:hypothetical protein
MNYLLWVSLGAAAVIGLTVGITSMMTRKIETPNYTVLHTIDGIEIRRYPKMTIARTRVPGPSMDQNGSSGFRSVANYIFGGNERNQKISMTAPVVMDLNDSASLYFVLPSKFALDQLPKPNSSNVQISELGPITMAVVRFGGFSSDAKISAQCAVVQRFAEEHKLLHKSEFQYMGYNAPWDVVGRRNEVGLTIYSDLDGAELK